MKHTFWAPTVATAHVRNVPERTPQCRTLMVVGQARSGTSLVAAVADAIGIYMGPPGELRNGGAFESFVFVHGSRRQKAAEVLRLNAEHDIWGWKEPWQGTGGVVDNLHPEMRNPYCVWVLRDPVAITESYMRHTNQDFQTAASFVWPLHVKICQFASETKLPSLLASFEKIQKQPDSFVNAMAQFIGVPVSGARRDEALSRISPRGGYVRMADSYGYPPAPHPHTTPEKWKKDP